MSELLAGHRFFSVCSSAFSSFDGCVGSFYGCVCSFSSCVCSFSGCFFSDRAGVCSHCVNFFTSGFSGFAASSEAQSRGSDCGSKNDLTHNFKSLFSG